MSVSIKLLCCVTGMVLLFALIGCNEQVTISGATNPVELLNNAANGTTLHAIIVADTNANDIESSVRSDLHNMSAFVDNVANNTGLTLNKLLISGDDVTLAKVRDTLKNLPAGPGDVVIFHYSGHGGRPSDEKTRWPHMYFTSDVEGEGLNLNDVFVTLTHDGPRFLLVMSDSCNSLVDAAEKTASVKALQFADGTPEAYRILFLETQGAIIASSSRPGENSLGTEEGGLFTLQFLQAAQEGLASSQPDWQMIMDNATQPISDTQHPQYRIYL